MWSGLYWFFCLVEVESNCIATFRSYVVCSLLVFEFGLVINIEDNAVESSCIAIFRWSFYAVSWGIICLL
ncbi:hypothetical protein GWI33_005165 [Rhynchophorus ferrugineus]|uniref:Uncharacterized protein n=1 Tax=Rhynchophorus ferrugineus TaxID=354439 RepID=A0A834IL14_RHYFE|nr:hypothetical protein GWI33_005165 [Rhynchophorus ferrugineus]